MGVIKRQSILNTIVIYTGIIIGFINLLYIQPNFLRAEEIGLTRVLLSFSSIISVLMPLGASSIIVRFFPQYRDDEKGHNGFIGLTLLYGFISFLFLSTLLYLSKDFITAQYVRQSRLFVNYFWLVFPFSFFLTFIQLLNVYAFSLFKSVIPAIFSEVVIRALNIVIILLYYYGILTFEQFVISFVVLYGINLALLATYVIYVSKPKLRFKFTHFEKEHRTAMLQYGIVMAVAAVASLGLKSIDVVIFAKYASLKMAGIYSIALFIGLFIETPLNSLERIANTKMAAALANNNTKEVYDIYHKSSANLFLIGGLLFLGVNACVTPLFTFLPEEYRGNEMVVLIISLGSLFNMASGSNTSIIYSSEHSLKGTVLLAAVFMFLVGMLFLLIPPYGTVGAAAAVALGSFAYNLGKMIFIKIYYNMLPFNADSLKLTVLIVTLLAAAIYLPHLDNAVLDLLYRGSFVSIAYLGATYVFKLIPEDLLGAVKFLKK
ncbi:MAG: oligosaccharide flippase family protein [Sphingobacteriales bacterium JAD_PAG50586_3]|nr:MAG: oligosaccharide flippase family protein [Sphingobacteriales bacterium JAD_PAG50586_3]